ncbi:MAG: hypothetical protein ACK41C_01925 [Phenylobacterium sp.]|uniref:hypothetical protein n=1 Tax=Phenylobacterium sp. TaxID=1871053 RepID=UPI00391BD49A
MDRGRKRAGLLGLALLLPFAAGGSDAGDLTIRAAGWLAPGADRIAALTTEPAECLALPADPARRRSVEIGRAAFRTPVLLGGQAARAGLSCESCHRAGRDNPEFRFPGVSGAPGAADVTHSLFSARRGDGRDNPVPIPDLSTGEAARKVSPEALPGFVHGLIVEEFDGPEPPPAVLAGVVDYLKALTPAACPAEPAVPITAAALMSDVRRAIAAAQAAPDSATSALMVAAARARLGLIDERFAGPGLAAERQALRQADRRLAQAAAQARAGDPRLAETLRRWLAAAPALEARLQRRKGLSLFVPDRISPAT